MTTRTMLLRIHSIARSWVNSIRLAYFRRLFGEQTLELYFPIYVHPIGNVVVGRKVAISAFVHIIANGGVRIGDNTIIASGVQITSSTHDDAHIPFRDLRIDAPVVIGSNVWIGTGAVVLPGVSIGDNSVVGAGSVVTRDVPANTVVMGVPARVARMIAEHDA